MEILVVCWRLRGEWRKRKLRFWRRSNIDQTWPTFITICELIFSAWIHYNHNLRRLNSHTKNRVQVFFSKRNFQFLFLYKAKNLNLSSTNDLHSFYPFLCSIHTYIFSPFYNKIGHIFFTQTKEFPFEFYSKRKTFRNDWFDKRDKDLTWSPYYSNLDNNKSLIIHSKGLCLPLVKEK